MKKIAFAGRMAILLSMAIFLPALSVPHLQVAVDGHYVPFPDEQPYVDNQSNRTMVPARFVAEKLGVSVKWNGQLNQAKFTYKDKTILLTIGQNHAQVNGKDISFDAPAVIKNNRTMVPLRFISEIFDAQVDWIGQRNLVVVTTSGNAKVVPPAPQPRPQPTSNGASKVEKGTWIWDTKLIQTEQDKFFYFAGNNNLTTIYLHIDKDVNPKTYQSFIRRANEKQIRVEALAGRPDWAFRYNQGQINEFITWVKKYNASVGSKERFEGLHFDIEPYLLEEWKTKNKVILENWMDNLRFIEKETKRSGLKITLDVPFWLDKVKIPNSDYTFSAWLLEKFDCLVIMDYRNFALGNDGIVENAHTIMREATTLKKQVIIAVDTAKSTETDRTTFYSLSVDAIEEELRSAKKELSRYSSFAGFAIHDYKNWTALDKKAR